jgi:hypothetical protein
MNDAEQTMINRELFAEMRDYILSHPRWKQPGAGKGTRAWEIFASRVLHGTTFAVMGAEHGISLSRTRQIYCFVKIMLSYKYTKRYPEFF